jgi:hypothetical protein
MSDKLTISQIPYEVRVVDRDEHGFTEWGKVIPHLQIIWIGEECGIEVRRSTLFHEVLHVISDQFSLEAPEAVINTFESAVYAFITENGGDFSFLDKFMK